MVEMQNVQMAAKPATTAPTGRSPTMTEGRGGATDDDGGFDAAFRSSGKGGSAQSDDARELPDPEQPVAGDAGAEDAAGLEVAIADIAVPADRTEAKAKAPTAAGLFGGLVPQRAVLPDQGTGESTEATPRDAGKPGRQPLAKSAALMPPPMAQTLPTDMAAPGRGNALPVHGGLTPDTAGAAKGSAPIGALPTGVAPPPGTAAGQGLAAEVSERALAAQTSDRASALARSTSLSIADFTEAPSIPKPEISRPPPAVLLQKAAMDLRAMQAAAPAGTSVLPLSVLGDGEWLTGQADLGASDAGGRVATGPGGSLMSPVPSAPGATSVMHQIAQVIRDRLPEPGTPVEVALDPPELGRVRLSVGESAGQLALFITAERPETADLMRRHLAVLAEEFGRAGLDAPNVSISQEGAGEGRLSQDRDPDPQRGPSAHVTEDGSVQVTAQTRSASPGSRMLDLRL